MTRNILIVSPDVSLWEEIRQTLDHSCCAVTVVTSRRAAVAHLERQRVDLMIAELHGPADEADLFDYVAARHASTRRVGIVGAGHTDHAFAAAEEGTIDTFIMRPWSHAQLYGILAKEFLNGNRTETGAALSASA